MKYIQILILSFLALNCGSNEKIYPVKGTIYEVKLDSLIITIAHDTIPDLMMPMVMPFNLKNSKDVVGLSIGDSVHFDFIWADTVTYAKNFRIVGKGTLPEDDDGFFDDEYSMKRIGQLLDNVTLLDLDSLRVQLSDSDGKYRFLSYIFTRCPMPNMCPAAIVKNQYLANYFRNKNISFLLISFDYLYDTPEVLNNIYGTIETDNMKFLSSYNHINNIFSIAQQSGVAYWGVEENNIGHSMRSILIDKNLKLIKTFDGIDWKAGDAKRDIENLIKVYK